MNQTSPGSGPPPPLPPRAHAPARPAPPGNARLRGCLIAAVVAVLLAVPMVAILAAIAVPAYHDYLGRSQVAQALAAAAPLQAQVAAFVAGHDRCPGNDDPGFGPAEAYAGSTHAGIELGESDEGVCAIELLLQDERNGKLDGHRLWLEYEAAAGQWRCSAEIEDRYLPAHCRG